MVSHDTHRYPLQWEGIILASWHQVTAWDRGTQQIFVKTERAGSVLGRGWLLWVSPEKSPWHNPICLFGDVGFIPLLHYSCPARSWAHLFMIPWQCEGVTALQVGVRARDIGDSWVFRHCRNGDLERRYPEKNTICLRQIGTMQISERCPVNL